MRYGLMVLLCAAVATCTKSSATAEGPREHAMSVKGLQQEMTFKVTQGH